MLAFLEGLSERSRALRFFSAATDLAGQARRAVDVESGETFGLVAIAGPAGEIVGHGVHVAESAETAEVAFAIAESYQGRGLATVLLARLASHAHEHGIAVFHAVVLPENHQMIDVFRESGFPVEVHAGFDVVSVKFPTELSAQGRERFAQREQLASAAAARSTGFPRPASAFPTLS